MKSRYSRYPLALRLTAWLLPKDAREEVLGDLIEHWGRLASKRSLLSRELWAWRQPLVALSARMRFRQTRKRSRVRRIRRLGIGISVLDVKLGARMLLKYPGLTIVGTVALSLTIATVTGVHAFTENFVGPNLPVPDGDRVVGVWNVDARNGGRTDQTLGDMLTWRREIRSLQDVGAFTLHQRVISRPGARGRSVRAARISSAALAMLREPPLLGRPLVAEDEVPGAEPVALIGFDLWQAEFGADSSIVGNTVRIGNVPHTVVGVMPRDFRFPINEQAWTPFDTPTDNLVPGTGPPVVFTIGRLGPGVTLEEAKSELESVGARLSAVYHDTHEHLSPQINLYARSFVDADDPTFAKSVKLFRTMIVIVLIVAAVNVGTLVYARTAARVREIAVRKALGAGRYRIVMQLFAEALVLASLAGAIGLGIAKWAVYTVMTNVRLVEEGMPYWWNADFRPESLLVAVGLVLLSAALTGILPALAVTGRRVGSSLQRVAAGVSALHFGKTATAVVVIQVAISLGCLTFAGSALGVFLEDYAMDDGVARDEYITAEVRLDRDPSVYDTDVGREASYVRDAQVWRELARRVAVQPGVLGVTFGTRFPGMEHPVDFYQIEGDQTPPGDEFSHRSRVAWVEPGYFEVFGVAMKAGRAFNNGDVTGPHPRAAIVNEEFVRREFVLEQTIGRRLQLGASRDGTSEQWAEIVGVVPDLTVDMGSRPGSWPAIYFPLVPSGQSIQIAVHLGDDPSQFISRLRVIGGEVDPLLILHRPGTLDEIVGAPVRVMRLFAIGIGLLVFAALALSAAGVYSLMSFTVAQRTREIGIRTALGAHPRRVVSDVFSRAILQLSLGAVLGLAPLLGMSHLLFRHGPWSAIGIASIILVMGLVACGDPMLRALRIQPTDALREDG